MTWLTYLDQHQGQAWLLVIATAFAIAATGNGIESFFIYRGKR